MTSRLFFFVLMSACAVLAGPPRGKAVQPDKDEAAKLEAFKGKVDGKIVWSTSRDGNHNIYIMNADGTGAKALTNGKKTDWFARFSPDGSKVLFTRSKMDWMPEPNAKNYKAWDTWIINSDGTDEKLLIKNATWATWRPDGKTIIFARDSQVWKYDVASGAEEKIMDAAEVLPKPAVLQNPHMSPDGKHIAVTLRGKMRETGVWDMEKKVWTNVGGGCQINWFPDGNRMVRMNPSGNGGSEVLSFEVKDGKPVNPDLKIKEMGFMDMPGRRSHEYFPQVSSDGKWLVWGITQRGHDHDVADYEIFIWEIGKDPESAVRLTFHSGNDRWPDIFLGSAAATAPAAAPAEEAPAAEETPAAEEQPAETTE